MARYYAAYKCPLCGALLQYGESQSVPTVELPKLLERAVKNQQLAGNPYAYMAPEHVAHFCPDGSVGLAHFAGFKICNE